MRMRVMFAFWGSLYVQPFLVFADTADISKVESFMHSIINLLVTFSGLLSVAFFVWGGVGYITSSGNPASLDRSKKTVIYSALGLAITLSAVVLSNLVSGLATTAFGAIQ